MTTSAPLALRQVWEEPPEVFARRLLIENDRNELQRMTPLFVEQLKYMETLARFRRVVAIKPRQVGFTTAATLFLFAKTYRSPHPRKVLQTVHDQNSFERVRRMVDVAYEGLPRALRFGVKVNGQRTEFKHNKAEFRRLIAGKRGQGRGGTFNDYHATEMAFYPEGSSALARSDEKADNDLFSSIQAAMHDPSGHIIVESTGNGPRGLFHRLVKQAHGGLNGVGFVFLPWSVSPRYRHDGRDGRSLVAPDFERTDEEQKLVEEFGLDNEQLSWRREKLTIGGYTRVRFRREYPITWMEPFAVDDSAWFSWESLNLMASLVEIDDVNDEGALRTFIEPEPGGVYFIAADTAGGTKNDEAVITVLRSDLVHCATWASNTAKPGEQARQAARMAGLYNNALVLCERNNYGVEVNDALQRFGTRLWRDEDEKLFWMSGPGGGDRKRLVMSNAREVLDDQRTRPKDVTTILQLQNIVEKALGKIEARGYEHDDRAISYCLALWCARRYSLRAEKLDPMKERAENQRKAIEQINKLVGSHR